MATRATYSVKERDYDETRQAVFYCHWDGYPAGAAVRFSNMVAAMTQPDDDGERLEPIKDRRGGYGFAFIRGNDDAEPTKSHEWHADTEYRYELDATQNPPRITVSERCGEWKFPHWRIIFSGSLSLFVAKYRNAEWGTALIVEKADREYFHLATRDNARRIARLFIKQARRFAPDNPNRKGYAERGLAWRKALQSSPV